ncbi:unnamed protein product [Closterium sp. Naga37s-1]|nr:unnamed protein product [Closterium sp. Naga37s-1]
MDRFRFLLPLPPSFSLSHPVAHSLTVSSPVPNHPVPSHSSAIPVHRIEPLFTTLTPLPPPVVRPAETPCQPREQPATSAAEAGATAATTADSQGIAGPDSSGRGKQPVRPFEECEDEDELSWRLPCSTLREIADDAALRQQLRDHELQRMLLLIDSSPHPEAALEAARSHPAFAKFLQQAILSTPLNPSCPGSVPLSYSSLLSPLSPFLPAFLPRVAPHLISYLFVSSLKSGSMADAFPPFPLPFDDCVVSSCPCRSKSTCL